VISFAKTNRFPSSIRAAIRPPKSSDEKEDSPSNYP
jgi:hypothetical protein